MDVARRIHSNMMLWASKQPNTCRFASKQILFLFILDALASLAGFFSDSMNEEH